MLRNNKIKIEIIKSQSVLNFSTENSYNDNNNINNNNDNNNNNISYNDNNNNNNISHSRKEKNDQYIAKSAAVKNYLPESTKRAVDLAMEKGASSWLTAIPIKDLGFDLNKAQFWDAIKLRYDWEITDLPSVCV